MKFILFVEGYTEKLTIAPFFKRFLDPKLNQPVGIKIVRFEGWPQLMKEAPQKAQLYFNDTRQKDEIIAIISLLDLYGPTFYPQDLKTVNERYKWAKREIEKKVNMPGKFFHFFAVHEIEAWLLSDPDLFPNQIKSALPEEISKPENINFSNPPSKLLNRLYKEKTGKTYKKTTYGKILFERLRPDFAIKKCPRLKELLNCMLKLAKEAGL